jgi:predicted chitinase
MLPFLGALQKQQGDDEDDSNGQPLQTRATGQSDASPLANSQQQGGPPQPGQPSGQSGAASAAEGQDSETQPGVVPVETKGQSLIRLMQSGLQGSNQNQGADVQPPDLSLNDPKQMQKTLGALTQVSQARPRWALPKDDMYDLAKTMVPGGGSKNTSYVPVGPAQDNVGRYLPGIMQGLREKGLDDPQMVLYALATINAETSSFRPVSEGVRRGTEDPANTTPNGAPFDRYEYDTAKGKKLGNTEPGDGALFHGRGFIQLTGRDNYTNFGAAINHPELVDNPDLANDPKIAGQLFAAYLKDRENDWRDKNGKLHDGIRTALQKGDLETARARVNGGTNGMDDFRNAYLAGSKFLKSLNPPLTVPGMKPQALPNFLMPGPATPPVLGDQEQ